MLVLAKLGSQPFGLTAGAVVGHRSNILLRRQDLSIPLYKRAAVIYNPYSGQLRDERAHRLVRAAEILQNIAPDVLLIPTKGVRTAGALAAAAIENGADLIIAAGGDGTISEVVDGIAGSHVPLGVLPAGTANVLAHEIGLDLRVIEAARQLARCRPTRVSLGRLETPGAEARHFLMMAGAGFDAGIIYELSSGLKNRLGKLSYFLGGLGRMGRRLGELDVTFDGQTRRCTFALASKVKNYGGDFEIARNVTMRDPFFELVLFQGTNSWGYLRYLVGVARKKLEGMRGVSIVHSRRLQFRAAPDDCVYLQADGELIGRLPSDQPLTLTIVEDGLTLLLPER